VTVLQSIMSTTHAWLARHTKLVNPICHQEAIEAGVFLVHSLFVMSELFGGQRLLHVR